MCKLVVIWFLCASFSYQIHFIISFSTCVEVIIVDYEHYLKLVDEFRLLACIFPSQIDVLTIY
jgi:hypothetical protein